LGSSEAANQHSCDVWWFPDQEDQGILPLAADVPENCPGQIEKQLLAQPEPDPQLGTQ